MPHAMDTASTVANGSSWITVLSDQLHQALPGLLISMQHGLRSALRLNLRLQGSTSVQTQSIINVW
jgi:hypothetical protein